MKTKLILLLTFLTPLLIMGIGGCEKSNDATNFMQQKLIGSWEWVASYGGVVGIEKPEQGEKLELIFSSQTIKVIKNDDIVQHANYLIDYEKQDAETYYFISINFDKKSNSDFMSAKYILDVGSDIMSLGIEQGTQSYSMVFNKIK